MVVLVKSSRGGQQSLGSALARGILFVTELLSLPEPLDWYQDADPVDLVFLGASCADASSVPDENGLGVARDAWLDELRETGTWVAVRDLLTRVLAVSQHHQLPVDGMALWEPLVLDVVTSRLCLEPLPISLMPQEALTDAPIFAGVSRPQDMSELTDDDWARWNAILNLAEAQDPPPFDRTPADALAHGLRLLQGQPISEPMITACALHAAYVGFDPQEDTAEEFELDAVAWLLGIPRRSPMAPIADLVLYCASHRTHGAESGARVLRAPGANIAMAPDDTVWHTQAGLAAAREIHRMRPGATVLTRDGSSTRLDPVASSVLSLLHEQFAESFGRPPGPEDPLFFDPTSEEPLPLDLDFLAPAAATLLALGFSAPTAHTAETTGLWPPGREGHPNPRDQRTWDRAVTAYRAAHPTELYDAVHDADLRALQVLILELQAVSAAPAVGAAAVEDLRKHPDGQRAETVVRAAHACLGGRLSAEIGLDPVLVGAARELARAFAGTGVEADVLAAADLLKANPDYFDDEAYNEAGDLAAGLYCLIAASGSPTG